MPTFLSKCLSLGIALPGSGECLTNTNSHYDLLHTAKRKTVGEGSQIAMLFHSGSVCGVLTAPLAFPLFREMRDRLMAREMKIIQGAKKVLKCKVEGIAGWS